MGVVLRPADGYPARLTGLAGRCSASAPHRPLRTPLEHFTPIDKAGNVIGLSLSLVLSVLLMIPARTPVRTTVTR
jgi:hypothetical protein